jgi:outer membrane receptor protein involved in Fe transport
MFLLAGLVGVTPPAPADEREGMAWADDTADDRGDEAASDEDALLPRGGAIRLAAGMFQPTVPLQPTIPQQPTVPVIPTEIGPGGVTGGEVQALLARREQLFSGAEGVTSGEVKTNAGTSVEQMLATSPSVQAVDVQRRSQVSFDPHVRGYRMGQIYTQADGAYWFPARLDLDTMLSKIDPGMIQDVVVVPGPYGLRYGPGFAFIDVVRAPTPRYECFENHFLTSGIVRTNGGQLYGR